MSASNEDDNRTPCNENALLELARGAVSILHEDFGIVKIWFMARWDIGPSLDNVGPSFDTSALP